MFQMTNHLGMLIPSHTFCGVQQHPSLLAQDNHPLARFIGGAFEATTWFLPLSHFYNSSWKRRFNVVCRHVEWQTMTCDPHWQHYWQLHIAPVS
jgi:hypothetical protein